MTASAQPIFLSPVGRRGSLMPSKVRPLCENALTAIELRRLPTTAIVHHRSVAACLVIYVFRDGARACRAS